MNEVVIEGKHAALVIEANLDLVHLATLLVDRGEMLLAVLGPFDRVPQLHGCERDQQLVRVEEHDLRSEAPAHVWGDHVDVRFGKPEEHGEAASNRGRRLRGVVDGESVVGFRPSGPHRSAFHWARGAALEAQT